MPGEFGPLCHRIAREEGEMVDESISPLQQRENRERERRNYTAAVVDFRIAAFSRCRKPARSSLSSPAPSLLTSKERRSLLFAAAPAPVDACLLSFIMSIVSRDAIIDCWTNSACFRASSADAGSTTSTRTAIRVHFRNRVY